MTGADCYGLCALAFRTLLGIEVPEYTRTSESPSYLSTIVELGRTDGRWAELPIDCDMLGTVLLFKVLGSPSHVGFSLGDGRMLHTLRGHDSAVVSFRRSMTWRQRLVKVLRYAG